MKEYISPYVISDKMLNKISDIMQELSKITIFNDTDKCDIIDNILNLENLYFKHTGNTLNNYRNIDLLNHPNNKDIPSLMNNLFKWIKYAKDKTHPLLLAGVVYSSFIFINPFDKDNIIIANIWLKNILTHFNNTFLYVSLEKYLTIENEEYNELLNNANDTNKFIEYLLDTIYKAIKEKQNNYEVNDNTSKLLNIMELNKPMTAYEIMDKLNIKSKETLRNTYLNDAIKDNLVYLTIPDKPTSKNQKYYRII